MKKNLKKALAAMMILTLVCMMSGIAMAEEIVEPTVSPIETVREVVEEKIAEEEKVVEEIIKEIEEEIVEEEKAVEEIVEEAAVEEEIVKEEIAEEIITEETPVIEEETAEEEIIEEEPAKEMDNEQLIATMIDALDPNRSVSIYVRYDGDELHIGDTVKLVAVLNGYENATYTLQWQSSEDDANWSDIAGKTGSSYSFRLTQDNYDDYWRVLVLISEVEVEG